MQSSNINQIRNILLSYYYIEERRRMILDFRNRLKSTLILKYFVVGNILCLKFQGNKKTELCYKSSERSQV